MIKGVKDGAVELYYNNSLKLHTVNGGVEIEGNLQVDGSGTSVTIQPTDGLINFGMDGRSSFVTGTNACYIFSGAGSSGDMPAGDLILQSRSNVNRTIRFVTGSSPAQRMSIDSGGLKFGTDTADANALDDYEEGSAVPDFANADNSIVTVNRYTYTKVGRLVHFEAKFTVGSNNDGSGFGFTLPVAQAGSRETVIPAISTRSSPNNPFVFVINANQSYAYAQALQGYGTGNTEYVDFAGDIILVSGTYEAT